MNISYELTDHVSDTLDEIHLFIYPRQKDHVAFDTVGKSKYMMSQVTQVCMSIRGMSAEFNFESYPVYSSIGYFTSRS